MVNRKFRLQSPARTPSRAADAAKGAKRISQHRPGGFHRPMRSSATRTSHIKRFCTMPPLPKPSASSSGTAQSRRTLQASVKDSTTQTITTGKRRLCNQTSKRALTGQFFTKLTQTKELILRPTAQNVF